MKNKKTNKKSIAVVIFALLLVFLVATAGTIAWLTSTSSISNTFSVGSIEKPTTSPVDASSISIDGNIYEPSWDNSVTHTLVPSAEFVKDPYVGIGKGSEDVAVYVYVENNFSNKVYFTINEGWEAVTATEGFGSGTYTSGLFKYTNGLSGATSSDVWTTNPLFGSVKVDDAAVRDDFIVEDGKESEIKVSCFLHQSKDSSGNDISVSEIEATVKNAFNIQ